MSEIDQTAQKILEDIREGFSESEIMRKHNLSETELANMLADLDEAGMIVKVEDHYEAPFMRSINASEIIVDLKSGMNDSDLMEKYGLTMQTLANTVRLLMDGNRIARADLADRGELLEEVMDPGEARETRRYYLDFALPVFDTNNGTTGKVHDLTEKGLGIIGIPAQVGEIKSLTVDHEKFALINRFSFRARCRWLSPSLSGGECIAGFEIIDISPGDFQELQKLVRMVTIQTYPAKDLKFEYPRV